MMLCKRKGRRSEQHKGQIFFTPNEKCLTTEPLRDIICIYVYATSWLLKNAAGRWRQNSDTSCAVRVENLWASWELFDSTPLPINLPKWSFFRHNCNDTQLTIVFPMFAPWNHCNLIDQLPENSMLMNRQRVHFCKFNLFSKLQFD